MWQTLNFTLLFFFKSSDWSKATKVFELKAAIQEHASPFLLSRYTSRTRSQGKGKIYKGKMGMAANVNSRNVSSLMRSGKMRGISAQQIHQGSRKSHSMQGREPAYSMKTSERVIFGVSNHV
jgi:hypothetical protein